MAGNDKPERRSSPAKPLQPLLPEAEHRLKLGTPLTVDPIENLQHLFWSYYVCWLRKAVELTQGKDLTDAPFPVIEIDEDDGSISIDFVIADVPNANEFYRKRLANFLGHNHGVQ